MDWESGTEWLKTWGKKYRYVLLILLTGVLLMLLPNSQETPEVQTTVQEVPQQELEARLALMLSRISGVGKADVLLTEAQGRETVYQTNQDLGQNDMRMDTVLVTDSARLETGLVRQVLPPEYRGALVVCQGADSAAVRLAVIEAVRSVTGLSSDCITVLKMK